MKSSRPVDVAIVGATKLEVAGLGDLLDRPRSLVIGGETFFLGGYGGLWLLVGTTGIGKVNAAATAGAVVTSFPVRRIWNVGCAGAYAGGGLSIGDVLISRSEYCGDEGIWSSDGVLPNSSLGIPFLVLDGQTFDDLIPLDRGKEWVTLTSAVPAGVYEFRQARFPAELISTSHAGSCEQRFSSSGRTASFRVFYGSSLTVGMVSGDMETAEKRFRHYKVLAENMEGSAVAQTALKFGIPVLECRGMSNMAGDRCKENWQLDKSIAHCHAVVLNLLRVLGTAGCK